MIGAPLRRTQASAGSYLSEVFHIRRSGCGGARESLVGFGAFELRGGL